MKSIAHIETPFREKFGVPRQAGLVDYESRVVFEPEYRVDEALRGIADFDYLWLIWKFHLSERDTWSPTVRPPRLGGNTRVGVFATRSPFRPNPIGLSSVRLLRVDDTGDRGKVLVVSGADLVDGTPILDIKPYITYADCHPDARSGFACDVPARLKVAVSPEVSSAVPAGLLKPLVETLSCDPRPHYQTDPQRVYKLAFAGYEVTFTVDGAAVTLLSAVRVVC